MKGLWVCAGGFRYAGESVESIQKPARLTFEPQYTGKTSRNS